jgi:hypothetical protein
MYAGATLWNLRPVVTTGCTKIKSFSPVFQGVDKEKPNRAFFLVFYPGIFLLGFREHFTGATNTWFPSGLFFWYCD